MDVKEPLVTSISQKSMNSKEKVTFSILSSAYSRTKDFKDSQVVKISKLFFSWLRKSGNDVSVPKVS